MKTHERYCWMMIVAAMMSTGCASKVRPQDGAMERARVILDLKDQNEVLELRITELEGQIANLLENGESGDRVNAPLPVPVAVTFASGCEIRAGEASEAIIRLNTVDARGRFIQMTGPVNIVIANIDEEGDPHQLADVDVGSYRFSELLRDGFMGMAYAIPVPIDIDFRGLLTEGRKVLVRAEIYDPRLASPLRVEQLISVLPSRGGYNLK
jgi:hypothetical protein